MKHTIYLSQNSSNFKRVTNIGMRFPENELHPVEFARLIPELLTWGNSHTIITHSETLINAIGKLIYEGKLSSEDFKVVILHDDGTERVCMYDAEGYFEDWPYGFFCYLEN